MQSPAPLQGDHPPDEPEKVQPTVRDALIGIGIGLLLVFFGLRVPYRYISWPLLGLGGLFVVVMSGFVIVTGWEKLSPGVRRATARARAHIRRDPQLGPLTRNIKAACWEGSFAAGDRRIELVIDGRDEPDPKLVSHARELVADFETVRRQVDAFLSDETKREDDPELAVQIAGLRVTTLRILSKKGAPTVEIDFRGPDEDVFWSCTYSNGEPADLWFD